MESISIMSYLRGQEIPDDAHEFMSKIAVSEDKFLKIIKDCMQYIKRSGVDPAELAIRYIKDLEEPEHQYLRVLFVLPLKSINEAVRMQGLFYNTVYRGILEKHLGKTPEELDAFRKSVNIVFDIENT